jgi:hypothetical protein
MGPGFSRMNAITVQQTTQGLVRYLEAQNKQQLQDHGVAIGYDGRHHSQEFAHIAAGVVMKAGYRAQLFKGMVPTPYVAAAVNYLHCAAGIMVTASHNTKEYNGYKVYWGNGCQIIPPHDAGIAAAIDANLDLWQLPADIASSPLLHDPYQQVLTSYAASQQQLCFRREHNHSAPPLVYTPLHGVGLPALVATFARFGLPTPHVVQQQAHPDPEFPTVDFPNPEEGRGTWAMAFSTGGPLGWRGGERACCCALRNSHHHPAALLNHRLILSPHAGMHPMCMPGWWSGATAEMGADMAHAMDPWCKGMNGMWLYADAGTAAAAQRTSWVQDWCLPTTRMRTGWRLLRSSLAAGSGSPSQATR